MQNPSHKDLLQNPKLLLQKTLYDKPPQDLNRAARAAVLDDGRSCILTESSYLLEPPLGSNRTVREREDFYFGPDDYLVWPQPFLPYRAHLAFISRRTHDLKTSLRSFLWTLPDRSDFTLKDPNSFTGLGLIEQRRIKPLEVFFNTQKHQFNIDALRLSDPQKHHHQKLIRYVDSLLVRLTSVPSGFRAARRSFRALQRFLLEFEALNFYGEFLKLENNRVGAVGVDERFIGAFTHNDEHIEQLQRMKVPFWYICPHDIALQSNVAEVAICLKPADFGLLDEITASPPVYGGFNADPHMYDAICDFCLSFLRCSDPFNASAVPELLPIAIGPSRSTHYSRRALTAKQRQKVFTSDRGQSRYSDLPRSKFDDPPFCPFFPPAIPSWKNALLTVDTSKERFVFELANSDTGYVFPEPASLVGTQTREKSQAMFDAWLKYRPLLLHRISSPSSMAKPKHGRAWSAILSKDFGFRHSSDQTANARAKERARLLTDMKSFLSASSDSEVQVADTLDLAVHSFWNGIPNENLGTEHLEQILWELTELNFRFELRALDRRARVGTPSEFLADAETLARVTACLPGQFLPPLLSTANHGLASPSLRERGHYLFAMARVLSKWRKVESYGWIVKTQHQLRWHVEEIKELETQIASFYTQSFHDCFRRPPVIPRQLSPAAVAALPSDSRIHEPILAPHLENNGTMLINTYRCVP